MGDAPQARVTHYPEPRSCFVRSGGAYDPVAELFGKHKRSSSKWAWRCEFESKFKLFTKSHTIKDNDERKAAPSRRGVMCSETTIELSQYQCSS